MKNTTEEKDIILEALREFPVIKIALKKTTIARCTYYRWIAEDKHFAKEAQKAIRDGILSINDLAEENLITMIVDKKLSAMKYWLTNHHKDYSRNGYIPVIYSKK